MYVGLGTTGSSRSEEFSERRRQASGFPTGLQKDEDRPAVFPPVCRKKKTGQVVGTGGGNGIHKLIPSRNDQLGHQENRPAKLYACLVSGCINIEYSRRNALMHIKSCRYRGKPSCRMSLYSWPLWPADDLGDRRSGAVCSAPKGR